MKEQSHFQGKSALEHLFQARRKGQLISSEPHGLEPSGFFYGWIDSAKDTAALLALFFVIPMQIPLSFLVCLGVGWVLWKTGRSALLSWARLAKLHRLIEEERFEIEHHREEEKEELKALYEAKGFSGKLLEDVLDVLMADDNRLLEVMLEEEFGIPLNRYEHPLSQALGAFLGTLFSFVLLGCTFLFFSPFVCLGIALIIVGGMSFISAKKEQINKTEFVCWNLGLLVLGCVFTYFTFGRFF